MRDFLKYFLVFCLMLCGVSAFCAEVPAKLLHPKRVVAVLPSQYAYGGLYYFIYQEASEMICLDTINELGNKGYVNVMHLSDAREKINRNDRDMLSVRYLNAYKHTLNIDYRPLKKISKILGTDEILIIATSVDTQTDFLKSTWWNFFNVPGADVVKPSYKIMSYVTLINSRTEMVLWQKLYKKELSEPNFGLTNVSYAPNTMQLEAFKDYSLELSKDIAYNIATTISPNLTKDLQPPWFKDKVKYNMRKKYDEHIENVNFKRQKKLRDMQKSGFQNVNYERYENDGTGEVDVKVSPLNIIIPKL